MNLWSKIRVVKILIQLLLNPKRTDLIFKAVEIVSADPNQEPLKEIENRILSHEGFRSMFEAGYVPDAPSLESLKACPEGSFGQALYQHMSQNGLDFGIWPHYENERPIFYLSSRIYQDHDLWHVLLGHGIEVEDEVAVQAFGVAQVRSPISLMLIAGGIIHLLVKDPKRALEAFQKVNAVYNLGRRAPFLLGFRLHDHFARPLAEVRREVGLVA